MIYKYAPGLQSRRLSSLLPNIIQCTSSPQPLQLILTHRMIRLDLQNLSAGLGNLESDLTGPGGEKGFKADGGDTVVCGDEGVGGFIREPEWEDTLFLHPSAGP
jgi:hypothetical protein